jgi:hypothetical protein
MVTCWRAAASSSAPSCSFARRCGRATADATRCNLSSWYVDPAFRAYAPMLVSQALRHKNVTYLNVSSAPHTRPIIEAQGFLRYCDGIFIAVPMLNGLFGGPKVEVFDAHRTPEVGFDPGDQEILLRARRARLHQLVVRHVRARLSLRVPTARGQGRHTLRAIDLLPRRRRFRALRRTDRTRVGAARQAVRHYRRERSDTRPSRLVQPRQHAEIFQRPAAPAPRRPRLHRTRGAGGLETCSFPFSVILSASERVRPEVAGPMTGSSSLEG